MRIRFRSGSAIVGSLSWVALLFIAACSGVQQVSHGQTQLSSDVLPHSLSATHRDCRTGLAAIHAPRLRFESRTFRIPLAFGSLFGISPTCGVVAGSPMFMQKHLPLHAWTPALIHARLPSFRPP